MRHALLLLLACSHAALFAQTEPPPVKLFERYDQDKASLRPDTPATDTAAQDRPVAPGDVELKVDPKIDRLMELHAEHRHTRNGYRVQIYLGDRRTAEDLRKTFTQKHPDLPIYMSWLAPNFRLRVGDLRSRLEAENLLQRLRSEYQGSYIVPDLIEMTPMTNDR